MRKDTKRDQQDSNKEQPLVSIVTPSYNQGRFIEDTILSVKNQDYPNIEHIIVDGGSMDTTLEILKKYENSYSLCWISEPDEGQYDAINKGFRMAKGDILGYINSDDMYLPDTISKVVNCFDIYKEVAVVYGDWYRVDERGTILTIRPSVRSFSLKWLRRYNYINPSAAFIWASLIKEGFFIDNSITHFGDWEWYLRMATAGKKFYFLNEKLCYFRVHSSSKTATQGKKNRYYQHLIISKRYNISFWKIKFWHDFVFIWGNRFFNLRHLLYTRDWLEILKRSRKILLRYFKMMI